VFIQDGDKVVVDAPTPWHEILKLDEKVHVRMHLDQLRALDRHRTPARPDTPGPPNPAPRGPPNPAAPNAGPANAGPAGAPQLKAAQPKPGPPRSAPRRPA
jgi:hypothetical protein